MLDAGTATYRAGEYLKTPELDIFLTHAHLDHVVGLTYLFSVMHVHPLQRITVHALPETLAAVEEHLFAEALFPTRPPFEFRPLEESFALSGGGRLTHFPLVHQGGSIGYRLDWPGHSMAYVTDTTADPDAAYVAKIRGVDLLVHECYFSDAAGPMGAEGGPQPHDARGPGGPAGGRKTPGAGPSQSALDGRRPHRARRSPGHLPQHHFGRRPDGVGVLTQAVVARAPHPTMGDSAAAPRKRDATLTQPLRYQRPCRASPHTERRFTHLRNRPQAHYDGPTINTATASSRFNPRPPVSGTVVAPCV